MKKILGLLLLTIFILGLIGCSQNQVDDIGEIESEEEEESVEIDEPEPIEVNVVAPYGTPILSMVKMFAEESNVVDYATVNYEAIEATDVLTAKLINGEADIAIVPTNLAANLYNQEVGYKIAGSSVWGTFYLVSSEEINSIEDVKGKTISLSGRGLTPDAILRYVLAESGIEPDEDVFFEYFGGSSEVAANYIAEQSDLALIPQPVLTNVLKQREDSEVVVDIQDLWSELTGLDKYPQASLIISEELIENHPEFVEAFIEEYKQSVAWINQNPAEAGEYYEGLDIGLNAMIVEEALPSCNINFVSAVNAIDELNAYLDVLYEFNPQLLGGNQVDEGLYLR